MSRVLLVGVGPMPAPNRQRVYATGLRLSWFLRALQRAGCEILLGELYFSGIDDEFVPLAEEGIVEHRLLSPKDSPIHVQIDDWLAAAPVDAVVALTDVGCLSVAKSSYTGPFHADYFGHPMAERCMQAAAHDSDASLHEQWLDVLPVLLRADRFSACSYAQRCALLGELGAAGRLNRYTAEYPFVEIIPPALAFREPLVMSDANFLRKEGVPEGARVLLSTGGFNTWMDWETFFAGLEGAMLAEESLWFVMTGGAIEGHVTVVYERFLEKIRQSPISKRFLSLGWVPHHELVDVMLQSDVAFNIDAQTYEGEFGCRNRLFGWLWAGLRVVSTVSSESTRQLVERGWVHEVPQRDAAALRDALLEEAHQGRRKDLVSIQESLMAEWGDVHYFKDLIIWVQNPERAPDRQDGCSVENPLVALQRSFLAHADLSAREAECRRLLGEATARLEGSRAMKMYLATNPEMRRLLDQMRSASRGEE